MLHYGLVDLGVWYLTKWVAALAYVGSTYSGWQKQPNKTTIQSVTENALSRIANHAVEIFCAGRTDSGVHASEQIIHFNSSADRTVEQWLRGANTCLPKTVRLLWIRPIGEDFHARFSATARHYIYLIDNGPVSNPFMHNQALWVPNPISDGCLQKVGSQWLGEHDFTSFRDSQCQSAHPRRRLLDWQVDRKGRYVYVHVVANAFLHHMVRNMMGVALMVGRGKKTVDFASDVLRARSRSAACETISSCGLYLHKVYYPESWTGCFSNQKSHFNSLRGL